MTIDAVLHYPDAISQVQATDEAIYWLATIATEDGRTTVRRQAGGAVSDLTPQANVRSRVMEYGGGAYSADGARVAYCDDRTNTVRLTDGDTERPLTPEQSRYVYGGLALRGDTLVAVREDHDATPEPRTELVRLSLHGDNSDGGQVIASGADFYAGPVLRDDRVAWYQWHHPNMSWDTAEVWTASLDDPSNAAPVAAREDVSAQFPLWLDDGRIAYVADEGGFWNWHIEDGPAWQTPNDCAPPTWVLNPAVAAVVDDRHLASVLFHDGLGILAMWDWSNQGVAFPLPGTASIESLSAHDGVVYVVAQWPDREATLVAVSPDGTRATLAGPEHEVAGTVTPKPVWAEAQAGRIHSWLYSPPGVTNPPLIVMTHGGPTAMTECHYDAGRQFWVSRGFAVLDVNYSGSTGFGRAYRNRLRGQWGLLDVSDVAAAVAEVTSQGKADAARVAITGGSAGGFTTLASLTSTGVYAAGISRYGIGDLTTLATDTHKAESRYTDSLVAPWPEHRAVYEDRSPINHLDRLSTPMLILQGTEDKIVPPSQAERMADAVRAAGQPLALVMLEGEGHGFRGLENRRTALEAQVSFLEQVFGMPHSPDVPRLPIENLPG